MRRPLLVFFLLVVVVAIAVVSWDRFVRRERDSHTNEHPNIVLIIIDTLRADRLNAYRKELPAGVSSELDSYANRGVRFDRAISQSSWTRPSIGSFLTSQYPRTLGIFEEKGDALPDRYVTLAEALKLGGYRTLGLTANSNINVAFNFDQGFDTYVNSIVVPEWMEQPAGERPKQKHALRSAPELFARALELVREAPDAPTFVMIDVMEVHEYFNKLRNMMREESTLFFREIQPEAEKQYLQMIRQVSHDIGRFVHELAANPGWDNTLFVIVSDHGEGLTSHPNVGESRAHGNLLYDSQNWVPLILFCPSGGLPAGRVVKHPVRLLDLMPTILDFAGVEGPEAMEGVSLMPLIRDPDSEVELPEFFVVETQFRGVDKVGVYADEVKLIRNVRPQQGAKNIELQANHIYEDGVRTDVGDEQLERRDELTKYLRRWEHEHPKADAPWPGATLTAEEIEQLRAIGYLQNAKGSRPGAPK